MLPSAMAKGRVLIIDDTPLNVQVLSEVLEPEGYEILVASDGESGLEIAQRVKPDLVLLDLVLPGIMGIEVLETLRENEPEITVILTTAYGSEETAIQALRRGVNDYIINKRPFDSNEVRDVVRRALAESLLRRENRRLNQELQNANSRLQEYSTSLEQTVAELRQAYDKLQEMEKVKASFISMITHELRHPITVVKGYLELAAADTQAVQGDTRQYLQIINENISRLARMIDDLLDLSRADAGHLQMEVQGVRPSAFVRTALESVSGRPAWRRIRFENQMSDRLPLVLADRNRMVQVLLNLFDNALKFTPEGGTIKLSGQTRVEDVEFCVSDTGVGIPADQLERVFDRFYQITPSDGKRRDGAGLGLAVTREIIKAQGGSIWVESEPGQGTSFHFTLLLAPEASSP